MRMVKDGNFDRMPVETKYLRTSFEKLGEHTVISRGKMTKRKVSWAPEKDCKLICKEKTQIMISGVMEISKEVFLLTLLIPLELTVSLGLTSTKEEALGHAIQAQLDLIWNWHFDTDTVIYDPQSSLVAFQNKFPGIVFDITGAGDHLPKVDIRIGRVKEIYCCVKSDLSWKIPKFLVGDLVKYAVSRINSRRTKALELNVCPRVQLTGRKINYRKEFGLGFGNYAEVKTNYSITNNAKERSEPCVALFSAMNLASSWIFWNIKSKQRVRRSIYKFHKTTDLVVATMSALSGHDEITIVREGPAKQIGNPHVDNTGLLSCNEKTHGRLEWRKLLLANLSVKPGIGECGMVAIDAIIKEFLTLFREKKALKPFCISQLNHRQKENCLGPTCF